MDDVSLGTVVLIIATHCRCWRYLHTLHDLDHVFVTVVFCVLVCAYPTFVVILNSNSTNGNFKFSKWGFGVVAGY